MRNQTKNATEFFDVTRMLYKTFTLKFPQTENF